jgi:XTP/dITP diphosphohydrolase
MKIYFVTNNNSKFLEAKSILKPAEIKLVQKRIKLSELNSQDQEEVVIEKARQAYEKMKKPVIVDDTAIYFHAYPNFPGTLTKTLFHFLGYEGIQNLLKGVKKTAYFRTLVCYKDKKVCKVFSGTWEGKIIEKLSDKINPEWPYNSIFIPKGYSVPLSELPTEQRIKQSHRKEALLKLLRYLREKNGNNKR